MPSLQCYWGLLLVFWASDAGSVHQPGASSAALTNFTIPNALANATLSITLPNVTLANATLPNALPNVTVSNAPPYIPPLNSPATYTLLDVGGNGLLWTPVLFSASWSVAGEAPSSCHLLRQAGSRLMNFPASVQTPGARRWGPCMGIPGCARWWGR